MTLTTRLKTRFRADFISLDLNFEHLEKRSAVSFRARENDIYKVSTKGERMTQKDREDSGDMQGRPEKSGGVTRRSFLRHLGAAGIAAAALPGARGEEMKAEEKAVDSLTPIAGAVPVTLIINRKKLALKLDPRTSLLDCLRENLNITGTKKGCDHGQCGACTVHVNGRRVNSCLTLAVMHDGEEITTIEGLGQPDSMHPMQQAFVDCDAYQCGYCTSGQIMSATALLNEPCGHGVDDIREAMSGNICRCGAYPNIIAAIQQVRAKA